VLSPWRLSAVLKHFRPVAAHHLGGGGVQAKGDADYPERRPRRSDCPTRAVFRRIMQHSAYRAAIDRGAIQLWMPRLFVAKKIDERRITFKEARDGIVPEGRKVVPLGVRPVVGAQVAQSDGDRVCPHRVMAALMDVRPVEAEDVSRKSI
jgi:hypothetical protein